MIFINEKCHSAFNKFLKSPYYLPTLVILASLFYVTGFDLLGMIAFAAIYAICMLYAENMRYALPPILSLLFILSFQQASTSLARFLQPLSIISFAIAILFIVASTSVAVKKRLIRFNFTSKKMFFATMAVIAAMLFAGLLYTPYDFSSLLYAFGISSMFAASYLFFTSALDKSQETRIYMARSTVAVLVLLIVETGIFYIFRFPSYGIMSSEFKGIMNFGWGISNTCGALIVTLIPAAYYLIYKNYHVILNYVIVFIAINATYFTMSRAALLIGFPLVVALAIICFIKNKQARKTIGIFTVLFIAVELLFVAFIVLSNNVKTFTDFFVATSVSSDGNIVPDTRGRTELWIGYFEMFKKAPIFGVGFYNAFSKLMNPNMTLFSGMAHNTIMQFLGSCGIVGLGLYLYHRYVTVKIIVKNYSLDKLIFGAGIIAVALMSLFDVFFISPYFTLFYNLYAVLIEKIDEDAVNSEVNANSETVSVKNNDEEEQTNV